jgi:hypothetical protein
MEKQNQLEDDQSVRIRQLYENIATLSRWCPLAGEMFVPLGNDALPAESPISSLIIKVADLIHKARELWFNYDYRYEDPGLEFFLFQNYVIDCSDPNWPDPDRMKAMSGMKGFNPDMLRAARDLWSLCQKGELYNRELLDDNSEEYIYSLICSDTETAFYNESAIEKIRKLYPDAVNFLPDYKIYSLATIFEAWCALELVIVGRESETSESVMLHLGAADECLWMAYKSQIAELSA